MKKLILSLALTAVTSAAFAQINIKTVEIKTPNVAAGSGIIGDVAGAGGGGTPIGGIGGQSTLDRAGQVIQTASSVVALGESTYTLVQHGKPSNTTEYAPISIVPKDPITKEPVSPFDMEDCSMPKKKAFRASMTTGGVEVVKFEYMVLYSYGCSYEGAGKYIQSVVVQPISVKTSYGWDFTASMKLTGMMNHGKKADPIVGALLTMKYSMNSWRTAFEKNDTVHIKGTGEIVTYSNQ